MSKEKNGNWFARHKVATVIIAVVVLGGIGGALSGNKDTTSQSQQQTATDSAEKADKSEKKEAPKKERLTLDKGWKLDRSNPYMTQVVGTVSNNSGKAINGYIQITFSALDADGANVGDCLDNANTVDANGKWKFKATCTGDSADIATVRFKDISGF